MRPVMTWLDWVQLAGVIFEVVAIVFAVREVRVRARSIRAFKARRYQPPPGSYNSLGTRIYFPDVVKETPTLRQRVASLEQDVLAARMEASDYTEKAMRLVEEHVEHMFRWQDFDADSLTTLVKDALAVNWRTGLPVVLLLLGLIGQNLPTIVKASKFIAGLAGLT